MIPELLKKIDQVPLWSDRFYCSPPDVTPKGVSLVFGNNAKLYQATAISGPGTPAGPQDPLTSSGYWLGYAVLVSLTGYYSEFRNFHEQIPFPGWAVRNGALLSNVSVNYPALLAELQKPANAWKLKTLAQWNALSTTAGGVGGVPFFVLDTGANTIKLPDTRGDYERGAGGGTMASVGNWHADAIRNMTGQAVGLRSYTTEASTGVFYWGANTTAVQIQAGAANGQLSFDASRQVPTASENRTRAFGVLPCVYIGGN